MTYYDLRSNTERSPRLRETKLLDDAPLDRPREGWTDDILALCGVVPVVATPRPADTDTTTHDRSVALVDGTPTVVWTQRPWTAEESAARQAAAEREARDTKLRNAIATLETWSAQAAAAPAVTQGTALARIDTITDNLGTFYGHFADLLRNQYGIDD